MVRFEPIVDVASRALVGIEAIDTAHRLELDEACRHALVRSERAGMPIGVWVELPSPNVERVAGALYRVGLPADQLVVQLPEAAVRAPGAYESVAALKDLGVHLAVRRSERAEPGVDLLRGLPVDILRFRASDREPSLVERAHELGLVVHAEEVDDEATAADLLARDCDLAQGRLFAAVPLTRPLAGGIAR